MRDVNFHHWCIDIKEPNAKVKIDNAGWFGDTIHVKSQCLKKTSESKSFYKQRQKGNCTCNTIINFRRHFMTFQSTDCNVIKASDSLRAADIMIWFIYHWLTELFFGDIEKYSVNVRLIRQAKLKHYILRYKTRRHLISDLLSFLRFLLCLVDKKRQAASTVMN